MTRACFGVLPHEIANTYQDAILRWKALRGEKGKMIRGEEVIARGKIVSLGTVTVDSEEITVKLIYSKGVLYLPNSCAGDKVISED